MRPASSPGARLAQPLPRPTRHAILASGARNGGVAMKNPRQLEGVSLSVHRVSTELGEGEADIRHTVRCPSSRRVVNLGTCEACPHLENVERDASGPQAISCSPPSEPAGPTPDGRFEPLLSPLL